MEIERAHAKRERAESEKQRAQSREFLREILYKERSLIDNLAKVEVNTQENSMEKSLPQNTVSIIDKKIIEENYESDGKVNESNISISRLSPQKYADKRGNFIDELIINSRENQRTDPEKSPQPSTIIQKIPESADKDNYKTPVQNKSQQMMTTGAVYYDTQQNNKNRQGQHQQQNTVGTQKNKLNDSFVSLGLSSIMNETKSYSDYKTTSDIQMHLRQKME